MSKKIARITQEKKLLLANEVVESNAKTSLNSDGRLDVDEIMEYPAELEGGRNLLKSSKSLFLTRSDYKDRTIREVVNNEYGRIEVVKEGYWNSWNWGHNQLTDKKIFSDYNSKYTLSLDVRTNRENIATIQFDIRRLPDHANVYRSDRTNIPNTNGKWERVFITMTTPNDQLERNALLIQFTGLESVVGDVIEYRNIKLEKGYKATPWTPAPEDLGLNYPDSIQNFNSSISANNIIVPEFIEGYPFVKPVIDDSLVLWLDGSTGNNYEKTNIWKDLSGNGNDGQLMNFDFTEDSGWEDGGLKFDGVDDYVECQNIFNVDYDSTYEVVVNLKRNTGSYMDILVRGYHWTDSIFVSGSQLRFYLVLEDGSSIGLTINNVIKYNGEILHITRVFKDGDFYAYINGELKSKTEKGVKGIPAVNIRNSPYRISHPAYPIDGDIKLVRIYNRALTDEEILQNYQAGQCSPLLAMRGDAVG